MKSSYIKKFCFVCCSVHKKGIRQDLILYLYYPLFNLRFCRSILSFILRGIQKRTDILYKVIMEMPLC